MAEKRKLINRQIVGAIYDALTDSPVTLLEGPRSVGKSTILSQLAKDRGGVVLDLDQDEMLQAVRANPAGLIPDRGLVCVDEYQRAPEVLQVIKAQLNRRHEPGRFILTGSTRHEALPATAQALTGRVERAPIAPLAQCEIEGTDPEVPRRLFEEPDSLIAAPAAAADYPDRVLRGGLPLAVQRSTDTRRRAWFESYIALTLARDVTDLTKIRMGWVLPQVLARAAQQTAQLLNATALASALEVSRQTARDYLALLENAFLIHLLPAWWRAPGQRWLRAPKVHVTDSGVAGHLLRLTKARLGAPDPSALATYGHVLESFAVGELIRQASWRPDIRAAGHWRERDGAEVDLVLEDESGRVVAVEVKAAAAVRPKDLAGLRALRDALGAQFSTGVLFHTGELAYHADRSIIALPISSLWAALTQGGVAQHPPTVLTRVRASL